LVKLLRSKKGETATFVVAAQFIGQAEAQATFCLPNKFGGYQKWTTLSIK
jgi:hypothetical protein